MPELPELEALRKYCKKKLFLERCYEVSNVAVSMPDLLKCCAVDSFECKFVGTQIVDVRRYGKLLIFDFSNNAHVLMHFALNGELSITDDEPYPAGVTFYFRGGRSMTYTDISHMGHVTCVDGANYNDLGVIAESYNLGLDPKLAFSISSFYLERQFRNRTIPVKDALMNQKIIAGIGNAYACEILFHAGIHPKRRTCDLTHEELYRLAAAIESVLEQAIEACDEACAIDHRLSVFEPIARVGLKVYARAGLKCVICGDIIEFCKLNRRNTFSCPTCQKLIS